MVFAWFPVPTFVYPEADQGMDHLQASSTRGRFSESGTFIAGPYRGAPLTLDACVPQVQNGKRAVNRKGFGYGGEDAYFYTWGPRYFWPDRRP